MKGRKPFGSQVRKAFIIAAAALGMGASTGIIESLDKDPLTDTQNVTTFQQGTTAQYGYNISPIDQMWKHTLALKSEEQRTEDLIAAAREGDSWRVQALLDHGINTGHEGLSALHVAIRSHHADVVNVLLDGGVAVNAERGNPLLAAIILKDDTIARILLARGADVTAQDSLAMRMAAEDGNLPMVMALVNAGADPAAVGSQALVDAAAHGHAGVVEYLLSTTKTFRVSDDGFDLVRVPDADAFSLAGSNTLTYKAVDVHAYNDAALESAVAGGYTEVARMLINAGANMDIHNGSPLAYAVLNGDEPLVTFMIASGADVNAGSGKALNMAVMTDNVSMAKILMEAGAAKGINLQTSDMILRSTNAEMKAVVPVLLSGGESLPPPSPPPSGFDFGI